MIHLYIYQNEKYLSDIKSIGNFNFPWETLDNKKILITGATGLIGSCFIDVLMIKIQSGLNCTIYAIGRDLNKAKNRFNFNSDKFIFISHDMNEVFDYQGITSLDYIFHLASNTHPILYATNPIETIKTNIIGTENILQIAYEYNAVRTVFASSNEVYGENRGDIDSFDENYCGYIDCNTLRAGYPESKRCGEALCQAYIKQYNMDIVIARFTRTYGPTMLQSDSKAMSQFIKKGVNNEDIILKSDGMQYFSYCHVYDAVTALLTILFYGENGAAYNIADKASDVRLKDLAQIIADYSNTKVLFKIPDQVEQAGYSKVTKSILNSQKLQNLGWKAKYDIKTGVENTIAILRELKGESCEN